MYILYYFNFQVKLNYNLQVITEIVLAETMFLMNFKMIIQI